MKYALLFTEKIENEEPGFQFIVELYGEFINCEDVRDQFEKSNKKLVIRGFNWDKLVNKDFLDKLKAESYVPRDWDFRGTFWNDDTVNPHLYPEGRLGFLFKKDGEENVINFVHKIITIP